MASPPREGVVGWFPVIDTEPPQPAVVLGGRGEWCYRWGRRGSACPAPGASSEVIGGSYGDHSSDRDEHEKLELPTLRREARRQRSVRIGGAEPGP